MVKLGYAHELWQLNAAGSLDALPPEDLAIASAALADSLIEKYEVPSLHPGLAKEDGGTYGAAPQQIAFWDAWGERHVTGKRIFAAAGANQSGKTSVVANAFCKHIRDEAADGSIFWIVAQSFPTLRDIPLRTVWELLPRAMFGDRWSFDPACHSIPTIVLDLPHGRGKVELWARSEDMSLDKFESARLNGVWWTECGDERIFHALQPRLLKHRGFMLMDYVSREAWHRDLSERALIPESIIHHQRFAVQNNAHNLPAGAIKDMKPVSLGGRGTMSEQEWRVRGLGLDGNAEGAVYPQFDPAVHCVKPFKVPDRWPLYIGADWGFRNPHAFLLATVAPNEAKFVVAEEYGPQATPFEVCQRMWSLVGSFRPMDCGQWENQQMMFAALRAELNTLNRESRPVRDHIRDQWTKVLASACVIDASVYDRDQADGTALADEFARIGFPTQPSIKHNKDGSVEMVRRAFEQRRLFFFDTCRMTRRDHATWRYKEKADGTLPSQDRYSDKDDHACDAVHYLLRANPCYTPSKSEVVS